MEIEDVKEVVVNIVDKDNNIYSLQSNINPKVLLYSIMIACGEKANLLKLQGARLITLKEFIKEG